MMENKAHPNDHLLMKWGSIFFFIGITPIFIIFYFNDMSDSDTLCIMYEKIKNAPSTYSLIYPVSSKLSFFYCKLSPFFSFVFFIVCYRSLTIVNTIDVSDILIKIIMPCLVITFVSLYMLYFYNDDISDSSWSVIKNIANNKIILLIYYILIFLGYYVWMFLFLIACFFLPLKIIRK